MHRHFGDRHDAEGVALTTALLLAEHVVLWPYRGRVQTLQRYALGVAALNIGMTLAALRRGERAPLRPWLYAALGGLAVTAAHRLRELDHERNGMRMYQQAAGAWPDS